MRLSKLIKELQKSLDRLGFDPLVMAQETDGATGYDEFETFDTVDHVQVDVILEEGLEPPLKNSVRIDIYSMDWEFGKEGEDPEEDNN